MKTYKYILVAVLILISITLFVAVNFYFFQYRSGSQEESSQNQITEEGGAQKKLLYVKSALMSKDISPWWINSKCIHPFTYSDNGYEILEIREKHSGEGCEGGDELVSPMVDTFRIKDSEIEWFEPVGGQFVPLDEYKSYIESL